MLPDYSYARRLLTCHYRVVLECRIRIQDVQAPPVPTFHDCDPPQAAVRPLDHRSHEHLRAQQILHRLLLATPSALDAWLNSLVWARLEDLGIECPYLDGDYPLQSLVEHLPRSLGQHFGPDTFYDDTYELRSSFQTRLHLIDIGPISAPYETICRASSDRTRRYKVVLGYEIGVDDYPLDQIEACYAQHAQRWVERSPEGTFPCLRVIPSAESLEDQRTLKLKLISDPIALDAWLRNLLRIDLDFEDVIECDDLDTDGRILMPVIEGLPDRARRRFQEAVSRGRLLTSTEEFWDSFDTQLLSIDVYDLGASSSSVAGPAQQWAMRS